MQTQSPVVSWWLTPVELERGGVVVKVLRNAVGDLRLWDDRGLLPLRQRRVGRVGGGGEALRHRDAVGVGLALALVVIEMHAGPISKTVG